MLENYLPLKISEALNRIPYKYICELRIRSDSPIIVNILGGNKYLTSNGFSEFSDNSLSLSIGDIKNILLKISNNSMYTINDELINGYVTIDNGIRVGVCGEVVVVNNKITTIKNITSLNFRFPHLIKNISLNIYNYIVDERGIKNTLIISPPGAGKTTYIRDLIYQFSKKLNLINILVVDERKEIVGTINNDYENIDVISGCTKKVGFINGIRSMNPNVIITDEINIDKDMDIIEDSLTCGVKIIATLHASSIDDLKNKKSFIDLLNKKLFDRFVVLSNNSGLGTLEGVFDNNLKFIGI